MMNMETEVLAGKEPPFPCRFRPLCRSSAVGHCICLGNTRLEAVPLCGSSQDGCLHGVASRFPVPALRDQGGILPPTDTVFHYTLVVLAIGNQANLPQGRSGARRRVFKFKSPLPGTLPALAGRGSWWWYQAVPNREDGHWSQRWNSGHSVKLGT